MLTYANYNALIDKFIGTLFRIILLVGALGIGLIPYLYTGIKKNHFFNKTMLLWVAFILLIILNNNRDLQCGTMFFTLRIIIAILCILFSNLGFDWLKKIPKYIVIIGFPNVFATLFFFVFRDSYSIMYKIYGFYPTGTKHGLAGYSAGIANHYSQNGTYISYVFITLAVMAMMEREKRKKRLYILLTGISLFALLLTQKRGHLLFSAAALFGTFFIVSKGKVSSNAIKTVFAGTATLGMFYLLSCYIEPIANLLARFSTAGTDAESLTRFAMWQLCFDKFKSNPLLGIGWAQFPEQYFHNLYVPWFDEKYKYLNAHNVYLQILCETGLVGIILYLLILGTSLFTVVSTLRKIKKFDDYLPIEYRRTLVFSVAIQLFFIAYCMTGNGLYDYSFYFYMISVTSGIAINKKISSLVKESKEVSIKY